MAWAAPSRKSTAFTGWCTPPTAPRTRPSTSPSPTPRASPRQTTSSSEEKNALRGVEQRVDGRAVLPTRPAASPALVVVEVGRLAVGPVVAVRSRRERIRVGRAARIGAEVAIGAAGLGEARVLQLGAQREVAVASATQPARARITAAMLLFLDIVALLALGPVRRAPSDALEGDGLWRPDR